MKYALYLFLFTLAHYPSEEVTYQLIYPNDCGEQFMTIVQSDVFYYGKVKPLSTSDTASYIYFISKGTTKKSIENEENSLTFYYFQYSQTPLKPEDLDGSKSTTKGTRNL